MSAGIAYALGLATFPAICVVIFGWAYVVHWWAVRRIVRTGRSPKGWPER